MESYLLVTISILHILNHTVDVELLGILLEITGAFYLARTFLFKDSLKIKFDLFGTGSSRLHSGFAAARNQFFSAYAEAVEARIGFFIVVVGLITDAVGLFVSPKPLWPLLVLWLVGVLIAEIARIYFSRRDRIQKLHDRQETL